MSYLTVLCEGCTIMVPARFLPVVDRWASLPATRSAGWWFRNGSLGLVLGLPGAWVVKAERGL